MEASLGTSSIPSPPKRCNSYPFMPLILQELTKGVCPVCVKIQFDMRSRIIKPWAFGTRTKPKPQAFLVDRPRY